MSKKVRVYLWNKPITDYDDHFIVKSMPSEKYNPDENIKNLANMLINSTPGNTLDGIIDSIASHIRELMKNPAICDGDFTNNPHWLESHIRIALIDLYQGK